MKVRLCFIIIINFLIPVVSYPQTIDSVSQVIQLLGHKLPRLSPIPEIINDFSEPVISLNGTWSFFPDATKRNIAENIDVPGEWVMQGYEVKPRAYAGYQREFSVPSEWKDRRIKLRCDAVYSECQVEINGKNAGGHLGGFTPFEIDISDHILTGKENTIFIKVRSESIADSLSSGSKYAVHQLGGISRKIYVMALPILNFSMIHISTTFDGNYINANINTEVELANESEKYSKPELRFELSKKGDPLIIFDKVRSITSRLKANSSLYKNFSFAINNPLKWDPEHPTLYVLKVSLLSEGKVIEVTKKVFGFKQTEIRGNQVFVNNMPIKLRGVCHHEVMPLRGRSLIPGQWEEDIRLFREANVNYIRTSHYPPPPELVDACDSLGMFVEVEAPFCWADNTPVPEKSYFEALLQPQLEMVNAFRSNPSVLMWSLANESRKFIDYFSKAAELVKAIDPTRPRNFSQWEPDGDNGKLEIGNHHYPGPSGIEKYRQSNRPIIFDEYCHLNAYNRFELVTDPGIRDAWGIGFSQMWDKMYHAKGILGGALWAAIDDSFFLPDGRTVGYGTWGPIDGWRRTKPEYWHIKKVYSPVKIKQITNWNPKSQTINFEIENQLLFSDLNECRFIWEAAGQKGVFTANAKPGETTCVELAIPLAQKVFVEVIDPRGVLVDQYEFTAIPMLTDYKVTGNSKIIRIENDVETQIKNGSISMIIDKKTQTLKEVLVNGKTIIIGEALLMVLPLNGAGNGIQMNGDTATFEPYTASSKNSVVLKCVQFAKDNGYKLRVYDQSDDAEGYTDYYLSEGVLTVNYEYKITKGINPRQIGLVFTLPRQFQQLEWERRGLWNYYPDDHIGRLVGKTIANNNNLLSGPAGPVSEPTEAWAFDQNDLGTNDFRSTKNNILNAVLSGGSESVKVVSDGNQSVRCWIENGFTRLLVASYSNLGAEGFFSSHAIKFEHPLQQGDFISGSVKLSFSN